ncbi:MAG: hypothetical protein WCP91_02205 [Candidatus Berkelbacteria bacterium]
MFKRDPEKIGFWGVSILLILLGVAIFSVGLVMWLFNIFADYAFVLPSAKMIGGLIVLALGYIVLELELIRKK